MSRKAKPARGKPPPPSTGVGSARGFEPETGLPTYLHPPGGSAAAHGPGVASIIGGITLMFAAYFIAEASLARQAHAWHWLAAVVGALVGAFGAALGERAWSRWRA